MLSMEDLERRIRNQERRGVPNYWYDICRYGAATTATAAVNTAAIQEAINAAGSGSTVAGGGAVVFIPPGTFLTNKVSVPIGVSVRGCGSQTSILKAGSAIDRLLEVAEADANGNKYGDICDLWLDGDDKAEICLALGLCVERTFQNIRISDALDVGLLVNGTQNSNYYRILIENCGDATATHGGGIRFNHGACGNKFYGTEIAGCQQHGIIFLHDAGVDAETANAAASPPVGNKFYGGSVEYPTTDTVDLILFENSSALNTFDNYGIVITTGTGIGINENTANNNAFIDCPITGFDSGATLYKGRGGASTKFVACRLSAGGGLTYFDLDDNCLIYLDGLCTLNGAGTFFTTTGTYLETQLFKIGYSEHGQLSAKEMIAGYGLANGMYIRGAATGSAPSFDVYGSDTDVDLRLSPQGAGLVYINQAHVGLGGGAAPTLGTIGGSGPGTAAQHAWLAIKTSGGETVWIPIWM